MTPQDLAAERSGYLGQHWAPVVDAFRIFRSCFVCGLDPTHMNVFVPSEGELARTFAGADDARWPIIWASCVAHGVTEGDPAEEAAFLARLRKEPTAALVVGGDATVPATAERGLCLHCAPFDPATTLSPQRHIRDIFLRTYRGQLHRLREQIAILVDRKRQLSRQVVVLKRVQALAEQGWIVRELVADAMDTGGRV